MTESTVTPAVTTSAAEPAPAVTSAPATAAVETTAATGATTAPAEAAATATTAEGAQPGSTPPPVSVPEKYSFTAPEGVTLDADLSSEFSTLAKGLKLSQEDAQKVVDLGAKLAQKGASTQAAAVAEVTAGWTAAAKTDKEFGGDKFDANLARANAAMNATATPQLKMLLDRTGLSNHPDVIRHFLAIAPHYLKDGFVAGGISLPGTHSAAKVLYPNNA